jgi:hypothetical protein
VGGLGYGFLATPLAKAVIATPIGAFANSNAAILGVKAAKAIPKGGCANGFGGFAIPKGGCANDFAAFGVGEGRSVSDRGSLG